MIKYLRLLLLPFSCVYGLVVVLRNWLYDEGMLSSRKFELPVISVGNLDVGGAGKSPMTEYLVGVLKDDYKLATLSRGYGRITKGYIEAQIGSTDVEIGDEPAQFKQKFPDIMVAVCESRLEGIKKLRSNYDLIILDDAYQHRAVQPGLSVLLFDFNRVNEPRILLPAGNLREPYHGYKRADVLIITKCPQALSEQEKEQITLRVKPKAQQKLFFTCISYDTLRKIDGARAIATLDKGTEVFLLTGIANPYPLLKHLNDRVKTVNHHKYPDHHRFSLKNITKLADEFERSAEQKKLVITTEKDAQRLREQALLPIVEKLNILVLPITVNFLSGQHEFDEIVKNYVRQY